MQSNKHASSAVAMKSANSCLQTCKCIVDNAHIHSSVSSDLNLHEFSSYLSAMLPLLQTKQHLLHVYTSWGPQEKTCRRKNGPEPRQGMSRVCVCAKEMLGLSWELLSTT